MTQQIDLGVLPESLQNIVRGLLSEDLDHQALLENMIPAHPRSMAQLSVLYRDAYALFHAQRHREALPLLVELLHHTPMHASSHFSVAACLHKLGSHRDAAQAYMAAYALDVDDPLPLFHLADCLAKLNYRPEAIQALERFIAEAPQAAGAAQVRRAQAMVAAWQGGAAHAP